MRTGNMVAAAFIGATLITASGSLIAQTRVALINRRGAPIEQIANRSALQPIAVSCRHDRPTPLDRQRRDGAVALARAINAAQMNSLRRARKYEPAANLGELPPVPEGFELDLYLSDTGYIFSIKDTLDPCSFAVFSDASGLLYQQSGRSAPLIAKE